ncbi:MAG: GNAT family N-acetyltransferase [Nocardioides sp.]|nr:GNAT family N-acetyltransferase [Nocardioides sp.]
MKIERIAAAELGLDVAEEIAGVITASEAGLGLPAPTGPGWLLATQHSSEAPTEGVWVARVDGRVVGWANLVLPVREYTDVALVGGCVHPDHRNKGIGRALHDSVTPATDRPWLRMRTWHGSPGEQVLADHGAARTLTHVVRRLDLTDAHGSWPRLREDPAAAARDYTLVRRAGPTPTEALEEMRMLREAINDAPDAVEFEAYPPDRITAYEQDLVSRRQTQYAVLARHRTTGEPAGLTMVCVDEFAPSVAHQEDTSVVPAHRGHGLGLLLKLEMSEWLRAERPEVVATDTWNAHDNHHMIALNERLGLTVVAHNSAWRLTR